MDLEFEEMSAESDGVSINGILTAQQSFQVVRGAILGYVCHRLEDCENTPPMTAAQRAFGSLWYGNEKPDLILSSEKMMKDMVRRIIWNQRVPVMYGCNFGFRFNGAIWSHPENTGCEIDDGWVFMLNSKNPTNFRFNGCYKAMEIL